MTKRFIKYAFVAFAMATGFASCNDKSSDEPASDTGMTPETLHSSTAITSFKLKDNSKVLANLSGVFFTIDLNKAQVFNADSLPYGTDVRKLLMNIGTPGENKVELTYTHADSLKTTTIEYTTSSLDSVNFTMPVTMKITSVNETYTREYSIKVNVHKVKSDSLTWGGMEYSSLPGADGQMASSVTVKKGNRLYCYTLSGNKYRRADAAADLEKDEARNWNTVEIADFGFTPNLPTMTTTDDKFFVLSTDGKLYVSTNGLQWTSTGETWTHIYGAYTDYILGVKLENNQYKHVAYPAPQGFLTMPVEGACPISGTSRLMTFTNEWSELPLAVFVGGRSSDGSLSGAAWGYDGESWAALGNLPKGVAYEGVTLLPYFTTKTNTATWTSTQIPTLFAICGRNSDGYLSRKLYISRDQGMNWHEADELMQLPADMPAFASAQGFTCIQYLDANSVDPAGVWSPVAIKDLPAWWLPQSRAVAPIESWKCPYIYIFGGEDAFGKPRNQVWRGVVNRLTFKPLQ